jgi:ribosomal protein L37E
MKRLIETRLLTKTEAQRHDQCYRCGHASYWAHGEAKCQCSIGPVKLVKYENESESGV